MFRIKICGVTRPDDALWAVGAGADAVGLNFYQRSPRYVWPDDARRVVSVLAPGVVKVGLFVNAPPEEVCQAFDALGLDLVQLHGDEPPELVARLGGRPVMRAFRLGPEGLRPVAEYLDRCRALRCLPQLVLLDAFRQGEYGGTGQQADWSLAAECRALPSAPPMVLAGGLTPANVAEAIRTVRPAAVDVSSGVESSPGRKDPTLVAAFVLAAREGFGGVSGE